MGTLRAAGTPNAPCGTCVLKCTSSASLRQVLAQRLKAMQLQLRLQLRSCGQRRLHVNGATGYPPTRLGGANRLADGVLVDFADNSCELAAPESARDWPLSRH